MEGTSYWNRSSCACARLKNESALAAHRQIGCYTITQQSAQDEKGRIKVELLQQNKGIWPNFSHRLNSTSPNTSSSSSRNFSRSALNDVTLRHTARFHWRRSDYVPVFLSHMRVPRINSQLSHSVSMHFPNFFPSASVDLNSIHTIVCLY
jgi:hypothetical protein